MQPLFEEYFSEQRFYVPTFVASQVAPKPISVALLGKRTPYQNPKTVKNTLVAAIEVGYLQSEGNGNYIISEKGTQVIKDIHFAFYDQINKINKFPPEKMKALASLLSKLVDGCIKSNLDTGTICLVISHNGHPGVEVDSLAIVDQHLDDLNAFRDDAHIAAWQPIGLDGITWEALTFLWQGEYNTAIKLAERLPYRDYAVEDYTQALADLEKRGWIEKAGDAYQITTTGKELREQVETTTDHNYYAPWKVLSIRNQHGDN
jgi:predicted transcriptional regulator